MISMQLLLRAMIPTGSSSGTPGGWTGATMAAAICPSVIGIVIKAWVGVSRKPKVDPYLPSQGMHWDTKQLDTQGLWSVYGNARRPSVAGSAVPSTEVPAVETVRPWYISLLQCVRGYIIKLK